MDLGVSPTVHRDINSGLRVEAADTFSTSSTHTELNKNLFFNHKNTLW